METVQYTLVYIIANLLIYMLIFFAVHINCELRFKKWLSVLIDLGCFVLSISMTWLFPVHSFLRVIIGWIILMLFTLLLHKGKWLFNIVAITASYFAMLLSDLILGLMMPRDAAISGEMQQRYPIMIYTMLLFINIVLQCVTVIFIRVIRKRSSVLSGGLRSVFFLAFPVSQLAAILLYSSAYRDTETIFNPWQLLPVILIFLLADVALIFSLRMSEKSAKTQARNEILEEQISFQKDYYAQLGASYEQIRKIRHDIDNHLYTMQVMLASGQTDEASQYVRELTAHDSAKLLFTSCENTVAASFLEKRKEDLEKAGIALECDIHMPADSGISNPDLICAFGNILDNAQEACEGLENATVDLHVGFRKPYLSISCTNPATMPDKEHRKRIPEMERGLGLMILEDLAKLYDGELKAKSEGDKFKTQLILKGDLK